MRFFAFLASFAVAVSSFASAPVERWTSEKVSYSFDTWIRVQMQGTVAESEDGRLIGESSPFIQSLLYTGNKATDLSRTFASESDWKNFVMLELCRSEHEVDLKPIRNDGAKGVREFRGKVKPFTVSISGTVSIGDKLKPFSLYVVCVKKH
jgi:hypothetical protein